MPREVSNGYKKFKKSLQNDPMYAWTWHCNIAMTAYDKGVDHKTANKIAHNFMKLAFDVETKEPTLMDDLKEMKTEKVKL